MRQCWVFKRDAGDYLHDFKIGYYGRIDEPVYHRDQKFAWRFTDRNVASTVSVKLHEAGCLKKLLPGGTDKRLAKFELELLENKKALVMALAAERLADDARAAQRQGPAK